MHVRMESIKINPRFREDLGSLTSLEESISLKGLIQPITLDEDYNLIAGYRRYTAVKNLKLEHIHAVIRKVEDEADAREIELFENIHRKDMTWQEKIKMTAHIHKLLEEKHGDWSKAGTARLLGKSRSAVADAVELNQALEFIPGLEESPTADNARKKYKRLIEEAVIDEVVKEAKGKEAKSKNVVWAATHFEVGDVLKRAGVIADGVMHFAEVDPPYAIDLKGKRQNKGEYLKTYNEIDAKAYPDFIRLVAKQIFRVLYPNSFCVWWFGPTWHNEVVTILREVGFHIDDIPGIWYKPGGGASANPDIYLTRSYEPLFICRKGKPILRKRGRSNVFAMQSVPHAQRIHATERPVELMQEVLVTFAYPGARVIVPFLGSGNTLLACYKEGMIGFGYDLSQKHKEGFLVRVAKMFPEDFKMEEKKDQ